MKHRLLILLCAALACTSCMETYQFLQVFETKTPQNSAQLSPQNGGLVYEDDNCAVYYHFWDERGDISFAVRNKTDQIMYVDLSKSFFIRNGLANDYYLERSWQEAHSHTFGETITSSAAASRSKSYSVGVNSTYLGDFGRLPNFTTDPILTSANAQASATYSVQYASSVADSYSVSNSASTEIQEQKIMAIPPHAMKIKVVYEYTLANQLLVDCDLDRYPSEKDTILFDETNTPLYFTNYITYRLGENEQDQVVKNDFYVSKISNYAKPATYKYVRRLEAPCQNVTNDDSQYYSTTYPVSVYDLVSSIVVDNCFYLPYEKLSYQKLYKKDKTAYFYSESYKGYVSYSAENSNNGSSHGSDH